MTHPSPPASASPGAEATFTALYDAVYPDLLRFVQRRVHATHAEDVVSDAFLVAWRRLDDLPDHPEDRRGWMFGIARNLMLNTHRGEKRRQALAVQLADATATAAPEHQPTDLVVGRVDLAEAWRLLSEVHQEALTLTALDDLGSSEAAAVLGISPVAYRLRLSRARRALRTHLDYLAPGAQTPGASRSERTTSHVS